jgi:hypothetical protein
MEKSTLIRIHNETKKQLENMLGFGETFDSKIKELIFAKHRLALLLNDDRLKEQPKSKNPEFFWG